MTPPGLQSALRDAPDGGVFFLFGADRFQKDQVLNHLVERYVDPSTRDFNLDKLRGTEVSSDDLARILATPPMMAEFRVVVVREVEAFATSARSKQVLEELLAAPPSGLVAILEATIPDGSKAKFYKTLKERARSAEFAAVSPDDVPGWLMARAEEHHGRVLEPEAARALGSAVGTDLGILAQELDKLSDLVEGPAPITLSAVQEAGTVLLKQDRWQWFDLLGDKRFSQARDGLELLLGQGESPVSLTIGLATHFLRLGVLADLGARALEDALPRHQQWLARRLQGQARRWGVDEIDKAIMELRRVDQLLKSSPLPAQHVLEEWILGLMVRARAAA